MRESLRILYVLGLGRSGSTLIGSMLHGLPGFSCPGEMNLIWLRGWIENQPCACGEPFRHCPFWTGIAQRAFGGAGEIDGESLQRVVQYELRMRHLPAFWTGQRGPGMSEALHRLGEAVRRLYQAVGQETGARVIVDTSKSPIYALFLRQVPGLDIRLLHLIRDPRAIAHSFLQVKAHPITGKPTERMPARRSGTLWSAWNALSAGMRLQGSWEGDYLRIRYEDFVHRPQQVFERIVEFAGERFTGSPFIGPSQIELGPNHILAGNFVRYRRGTVDIKPDMRWKSAMSAPQKALVTALTWPLLPFYGYPLIP
jgi:hypothetical protein